MINGKWAMTDSDDESYFLFTNKICHVFAYYRQQQGTYVLEETKDLLITVTNIYHRLRSDE